MIEYFAIAVAVASGISLCIVFSYFGVRLCQLIFDGKRQPIALVKTKHFVETSQKVTVITSDNKVYRDCTYVGFSCFSSNSAIPHNLQNWLVIEDVNGKGYISTDTVRYITTSETLIPSGLGNIKVSGGCRPNKSVDATTTAGTPAAEQPSRQP